VRIGWLRPACETCLIFARPNASIIFTSHGMLISPVDFYYDIGTKNLQFCDAA
jgi:hypothetical protein